jgi:DNA-binding XRE family transcriptional regulator
MSLKTVRERLRLTQADVAQKCDISTVTVSRIESNPDYVPSFRIRRKLAKGLKVKLEELDQ